MTTEMQPPMKHKSLINLTYEPSPEKILSAMREKLNIHDNSICNHESGLYCHELYTILNYCKFYNINISEFLEGIEV